MEIPTKFTIEAREKMRQAKLKNPVKFWLGKKHYKTTKEKMSVTNIRMGGSKRFPNYSGEKSHRWIKDRTQLKETREKAYDTKYKYWMLEVKKRDGWKCRIQNKDCDGKLEAHHILNWRDFVELRYEINNGITLCHFHHPRKRSEEANLSPYFQELVGNVK